MNTRICPLCQSANVTVSAPDTVVDPNVDCLLACECGAKVTLYRPELSQPKKENARQHDDHSGNALSG
jgi:hypothetical protein